MTLKLGTNLPLLALWKIVPSLNNVSISCHFLCALCGCDSVCPPPSCEGFNADLLPFKIDLGIVALVAIAIGVKGGNR